jgi:shikimate 5-dehydrogenase
VAGVRYAIAGSPVEHSLSPLLLAIVHDHLTSIKSKTLFDFNLLKLDLIDTKTIEDALAWGYAGSMPNALPWALTGAPFGKFRTTVLLEKAIAGSREIVDCSPLLESKSTKSLQLQIQEMSEKMQLMANSKLPNSVLNEEIWINLTSPLKHTLVSGAVSTIDNSMKIQSVNCLRWDGQGWFCGTFDGLGVISAADYHGIDVANDATIAILGGGGAARSTAHAWINGGGKVIALEGRRPLSGGNWIDGKQYNGEIDIFINFDGGDISNNQEAIIAQEKAQYVFEAPYSMMQGTGEERVSQLAQGPFNGRWLLVGQHLECWSNFWAPQLGDMLPSVGLLLTKLAHAEAIIDSYAK